MAKKIAAATQVYESAISELSDLQKKMTEVAARRTTAGAALEPAAEEATKAGIQRTTTVSKEAQKVLTAASALLSLS